MQVLVLGMHRSGTSIVSRMLNIIGFHLGASEEMMRAKVDNPAGFWERKDVYELNEAILKEAGASWDTVVGGEISRLSSSAKAVLTTRVGEIFNTMNASPQWALKDPRFCTVLQLWRGLLQEAVVVFVSRSPAQIAASLEVRNGLPQVVGIALCEAYYLAGLKASHGLPHVFVNHDLLLADPYKAACQLRDDLQKLGAVDLRDSFKEEIETFVDRKLFRSRVDDSAVHDYLNDQRRRLFAELAAGKPAADWVETELSRDSREIIEMHKELLGLEAKRHVLSIENDSLERDSDRLRSELERSTAGVERETAALKLSEKLAEDVAGVSAAIEGFRSELGVEAAGLHKGLSELAEGSRSIQSSLMVESKALRDELNRAEEMARRWEERSLDAGLNLEKIHASRMWRFWMAYHRMRQRILHPFSKSRGSHSIKPAAGEGKAEHQR